MSDAYGFSTSPTGLVVRLDQVERALLATFARQMIEFVAPAPTDPDADPLEAFVGIDRATDTPDDPVLARLFPDAYRDDPDASMEFRRFTERSLRDAKVASAAAVAAALEPDAEGPRDIEIDTVDVPAWLGFLNDTRLALGTRLEITEDSHDELAGLADDDPRVGPLHVYDWLTYLQDSMVQLLLPPE